MMNRKTKWLVLGISDMIIQALVLILCFPQRITNISGKEILFAVMSLGWILLAPRIRKVSIKMLMLLAWVGIAGLLRSPSMMLLFGAVWLLEFFGDTMIRKVATSGKPQFSATEILAGLGLICVFAIISTAYPAVNVNLSTALLFVSFLLKLNISPVRMWGYPDRSIDSYLLARRGVQFAHAFLGNTFMIIGAPLLLVDIVAYVLMFKREFDHNLFARKKVICEDEKDEAAETGTITRVIISGPSSVGKDATIKKLLERLPNARPSVSATDREPRRNEVEGVDYYFKSTEEFEELIRTGALVEYTHYDGHYYGTLVEEKCLPGEMVIYNVEPGGHDVLKNYFPDAVSILIAAPAEMVEARMRKRDKDASEEQIRARMGTAANIMRRSADYDFFVVNDYSADDTANQIEKILAILNLRTCARAKTIKKITQSFLKYE